MAEAKKEAPSTSAEVNRTANSTPREVLAARIQAAKAAGLLTPKLQRQFDRMAANLLKGKK